MPGILIRLFLRNAPFIQRAGILSAVLFALTALSSAQDTMKGANWDAYRFLLGEWVGQGGGTPGEGAGRSTFSLDLQGSVLIRKSFADYPASKGRPAYSHDDLMVVYRESNKPAKAIYFDNEGHIIHYSVEFSKDSASVTFLSDIVGSAPRFRLRYTESGNETLKLTFEIASPDHPDVFSPYIEAVQRRIN